MAKALARSARTPRPAQPAGVKRRAVGRARVGMAPGYSIDALGAYAARAHTDLVILHDPSCLCRA